MTLYPPVTAEERAAIRAGLTYTEREADIWARHLLNRWGVTDGFKCTMSYACAYPRGAAGYVFWVDVAARICIADGASAEPSSVTCNGALARGVPTTAGDGSVEARADAPRWRDEKDNAPKPKGKGSKQGSLF